MAFTRPQFLASRPDLQSISSHRHVQSAQKYITKAHILVVISLAITWWIASLIPHYTPMIQETFRSRVADAREKIPSIKVDWQVEEDPRAKYDQRKVALIIEPRPLPHLVPQMLHMMSVVPPDWRFVFIGSEMSVVGVGRAQTIKHQQVLGKLDLLVLPEPWSIESKEHIFRVLTDMRFYDEFLPGVEWILKYEADSIMCANSPHSLNEWLDWSWAGAPRKPNDHFGGNGGLSIRRVSAIRRVLSFQRRMNDSDVEDEWFGKRLWVLPGEKVATGQEGVFAVENVYYENPMGFHLRNGGKDLKDEVWKNRAQRKKILDYCPELSMLLDMKMERERCEGDTGEGEIVMTPGQIEEERKKLEEGLKKLQEEEKEQKEREAAARKKQAEEEAKRKKLLEEGGRDRKGLVDESELVGDDKKDKEKEEKDKRA